MLPDISSHQQVSNDCELRDYMKARGWIRLVVNTKKFKIEEGFAACELLLRRHPDLLPSWLAMI